MKGLLIKDFKLLTRNKSTLLIVLAIILFFPMLEMDPGFIVSYTMIILLFLTVSTISYDDFDNGMAFLFTLPIDRKTYVREKYVLGLVVAVASWILAVFINVAYMSLLANESAETIGRVLLSVLMIFPAMLLMWEVILPLQLKFGAEKARVVLFIVAGVSAAIGVITTKIAAANEEQANKVVNAVAGKLVQLTPMQVGIALFAVAVAGLLISYASSVRIVEKKEY
ncbi:MAG: ABC-2 transporter permease [Lachnospiraceae bacterium]|nr:ABC-2 transporter permease [Lachnospiraceae bacterium]